jgi:hypothetical protein
LLSDASRRRVSQRYERQFETVFLEYLEGWAITVLQCELIEFIEPEDAVEPVISLALAFVPVLPPPEPPELASPARGADIVAEPLEDCAKAAAGSIRDMAATASRVLVVVMRKLRSEQVKCRSNAGPQERFSTGR